ncbi:MAG: type II toxin-antitoxin system HicB family antitoxin, partial [Alphaproteobacteria bacterium]|nr:type II toxin-antitoxin system HicB family antitoxin [Alphaproteobacteria bacterium]
MTEKTYIGLVIKEPDTAYWVAFPDFKCCFTCGDSLSNAESTARDALETHIAGMVRDGFTVPEPSDINDILRDNDMAVVTLLEV